MFVHPHMDALDVGLTWNTYQIVYAATMEHSLGILCVSQGQESFM